MSGTKLTGDTTRRGFLIGAGAVTAGAFLAACGSDDKDNNAAEDATTTTAKESGGGDIPSADLDVAELAAGLEVLAVTAYQMTLDAATGNKIGAVPPAVAEFVTTGLAQHKEHRDAWNEVLTANGRTEVTEPNAKLTPTVTAEFAKVKDVVGAAKLALSLEDIAGATYLDAINKLTSEDAIALAGKIYPIDMQHAAVLHFVLGEYPVPNVFGQTKNSAAA